ncbi:MarR family winged helix-turn-helix transcriptional regulator [Anaerolentibacter hominis]|uniref:MarR family winged helix-turn-helix transcriptional regulator n=1 Tax=Anaerolentibacter hominis TaxID=3079009 RepID=UPI0031B8845C
MSEYMKNKELIEKMMHLQWLIQRQHVQMHGRRGPFADPTRGQGRVLALLKMQPEISTRDLSYVLNIRQQSLSELLGKLEKAGYITRSQMESDRRVVMVKLTESGKSAEQESPAFPDLFGCLNEDEQAAFGDYLDRIIARAEKELGEDGRRDMEHWMAQARARMGDDAFEDLMAMRRNGFTAFGNEDHRRSRGRREERRYREHCRMRAGQERQ